jgi:cell wall-associated NlpC family hydrolase
MNKYQFQIIFSLIVILSFGVVSCSTKKKYRNGNQTKYIEQHYNHNLIRTILYNQYEEWKGTPHKTGGMSKQGVDCSGLVFLTYKYQFGVELPRTTKKQADIGKVVGRDDLSAGDLLFFKTGIWNRHVGIFIERNMFLHSSTSRGVIISSLDDDYWRKSYYLAKRIDFK